jgi:hypothetical protein
LFTSKKRVILCERLFDMDLLLITIGLLALGFGGIAIKIWAKKGGEFAGTCASNNPLLQEEGAACGLCGARPEEQCKNSDAESK